MTEYSVSHINPTVAERLHMAKDEPLSANWSALPRSMRQDQIVSRNTKRHWRRKNVKKQTLLIGAWLHWIFLEDGYAHDQQASEYSLWPLAYQ